MKTTEDFVVFTGTRVVPEEKISTNVSKLIECALMICGHNVGCFEIVRIIEFIQ